MKACTLCAVPEGTPVFCPCRGCLRLLCASCPSLHYRVADRDSRLWHRTCAERARIEFRPWPGVEALRREKEAAGQMMLEVRP